MKKQILILLFILLLSFCFNKNNFLNTKSIPKVIHKIFITNQMEIKNISDDINNAINTWTNLNPGYTLKSWSGNDCLNYLKENFSQKHVDCFNKLVPYAYKVDFMRYCIIYNEGGWYSDYQQKLLISLDSINDNNYNMICCRETLGDPNNSKHWMQNGCFGSIKNNIIFKKCINSIIENCKNKYYGKSPWDPTGPALFGKMFEENNSKLKNFKLGYMSIDKKDGPCYYFDNKKCIINKCCTNDHKPSTDFEGGNNYMELWKNKKVYN